MSGQQQASVLCWVEGAGVAFGHDEVVIICPTHDVAEHLGVFILQLGIKGDALYAINRERLQQWGITDAVVAPKGGKGSAHAFRPVTGSKFSARVRLTFNDDFFHVVLLVVLLIITLIIILKALVTALIVFFPLSSLERPTQPDSVCILNRLTCC